MISGDVASCAGTLYDCGFTNSSPLSLGSLSPKLEHGVRDWFWWQKLLEAPDSALGQAYAFVQVSFEDLQGSKSQHLSGSRFQGSSWFKAWPASS